MYIYLLKLPKFDVLPIYSSNETTNLTTVSSSTYLPASCSILLHSNNQPILTACKWKKNYLIIKYIYMRAYYPLFPSKISTQRMGYCAWHGSEALKYVPQIGMKGETDSAETRKREEGSAASYSSPRERHCGREREREIWRWLKKMQFCCVDGGRSSNSNSNSTVS